MSANNPKLSNLSVGNANIKTLTLDNPLSSDDVNFLQAGVNAVPRSVNDKLQESISVNDYASLTDVKNHLGTFGTVLVPLGENVVPSKSTGKNICYNFQDYSDSRNVLTGDGVRGGLFAERDNKSYQSMIAQIDEDQTGIPGSGFRDVLYIQHLDNDTADYTTIGQKVTYGIRAWSEGNFDLETNQYVKQYKDIVAGNFTAIGNIHWNDRGVSGINADAIQYGTGIASNEFAVQNPSFAPYQCTSMAAVQAIVNSSKGDNDAFHNSWGVLVVNVGTNRIFSAVAFLGASSFQYGLDGYFGSVTDAAIRMPQSVSGNAGTTIEYDVGDYTDYDRTNNRYNSVIGGSIPFSISGNGIQVGAAATSTSTRVAIEPSTTNLSHINLSAGVAPTAPNDGDIWFDGTNLKIQIGGVTRTVTVT